MLTALVGAALLFSSPASGLTPSSSPPTLPVTVTGTGQAPLPGVPAAARTVALSLAKRDAAERALGASVSLTSLPDQRRVLSQLEGTMTYRVLQEGEEKGEGGEGGSWTVRILATVFVPREVLEAHPLSPEERELGSGFRPLVEEFPDGLIDWQEGYLLAYGHGRPPAGLDAAVAAMAARRAAVVDAQARALELVAGVRADAERRTRDLTGKDPELRLQLEGRVREAEVVRVEQGDPCRVVLKVPLTGVSGVSVLLHDAVVPPGPAPPAQGRGPEAVEGHTGLLVDARGTGVRPALFPRILDRDGTLIYSVESVERDAFLLRGVAGYALAEPEGRERAGENPLVVVASAGDDFLPLLVAEGPGKKERRKRQGENPLQVRGLHSSGALRANLVIGAEDARRIAGDPALARLLKESRVIVLTDPAVGGSEGVGPAPRLAARPGALP